MNNNVGNTSIVSEQTIAMLAQIQKYIQRSVIWIIIGAIIVGAIIILIGGETSVEIVGKFAGTLAIIALMLVVSINNFKRISSRVRPIQLFAITGFITNLIWAVLWILLCWNPQWGAVVHERVSAYSVRTSPSAYFKTALIVSFISGASFLSSNILAIPENNKSIRPLKITSVICVLIELALLCLFTLLNFEFPRRTVLERLPGFAGFIGFAIVVMIVVIRIISNSAAKSASSTSGQPASASNTPTGTDFSQLQQAPIAPLPGPQDTPLARPKTDAELRAEIEEQVRREIIEKEVREKLAAEMSVEKSRSLPPQNAPDAV